MTDRPDVKVWAEGTQNRPSKKVKENDLEALLKQAAIDGWNACRSGVYAVCEDIENRANSDKNNAIEIAYHFHRGEISNAKSIARGFNSFEAVDDDRMKPVFEAIEKEVKTFKPISGDMLKQLCDDAFDAIEIPLTATPSADLDARRLTNFVVTFVVEQLSVTAKEN